MDVVSRTGVYGVVEEQGKWLVIRQKRGPHAGKYDLPGGGIEPGEGIEEALRREFVEEVGMRFGEMRLMGNFTVTTEAVSKSGEKFLFHQIALVYRVDYCESLGSSGEFEHYWIDPNRESELSPLVSKALELKKIK